MSPHTSPSPAARARCPLRLGELDASARLDTLYRDYAPRLVAVVAAKVGRHRDEVEDGCQFAWSVLARRPDVLDGPNPKGWLITVAARECVAESRRAPLPVDWVDDVPAPSVEERLEAHAALRRVADLRPVRRRVFERHLAGLSYAEIVTEQGLTYTNVNRQITEARAELRTAA